MGSKKTTTEPKAKAPCPINKEDFTAKAQPIAMVVNGETKALTPKHFASGSYGWFANEKVTVVIDGVPVKVQANVILTVVNSKPAG